MCVASVFLRLPVDSVSCDNTYEILSTRAAYCATQATFYWRLVMYLLPGMYQNVRLPEGKHVFSINHIVVQQVGHSKLLLSGRGLIHTLNPSSQGILQVKGQPCSQAFQGTVVSSLLWSFLSAHGYVTIYSATSN